MIITKKSIVIFFIVSALAKSYIEIIDIHFKKDSKDDFFDNYVPQVSKYLQKRGMVQTVYCLVKLIDIFRFNKTKEACYKIWRVGKYRYENKRKL